MPLTCHQAKRQSSAYVDGRLRLSERAEVVSHLASCESCASYFEQVLSIKTALRQLPAASVPERLRVSLRVIASRHQAELTRTHGSRLAALWEHWKFRLSEAMRPLALPATGGLLSSMLLFGTFILTIGTTTRMVSYEIPLNGADESQQTTLVPLELRTNSVVLNMSFDSNGRIGDYAVDDPSGRFTAGLQARPASISVPEFSTVFGGSPRISGDIQIKFSPIAYRQ